MTQKTVGFIGVGLMGHGMAKNIVEKGYPLLVMAHRNRAPVDDLVARGAREVPSPRAMAAEADVIVLCVTGSPQVEAVLRGPDGIESGARAGLVVIDTSTSDPVSTAALAKDLAARGVTLVDAPLSRRRRQKRGLSTAWWGPSQRSSKQCGLSSDASPPRSSMSARPVPDTR